MADKKDLPSIVVTGLIFAMPILALIGIWIKSKRGDSVMLNWYWRVALVSIVVMMMQILVIPFFIVVLEETEIVRELLDE